jgi:hypothetical protein
LTFEPGESLSRSILITSLDDAVSQEGSEIFFVNLANTNVPLDDDQGVGVIVDDDGPDDIYEASQDTPVTILDPHPRKGAKPAVSHIEVTSIDNVGWLEVVVDIAHADEANLKVTLASPTVEAQELLFANDQWNVVDLTPFIGQQIDGTWTLTVADMSRDGATGTLNTWSLAITPIPAGSGAASSLLVPPTLPLAWIQPGLNSEIESSGNKLNSQPYTPDDVFHTEEATFPTVAAGPSMKRQDTEALAIDTALAELDAIGDVLLGKLTSALL